MDDLERLYRRLVQNTRIAFPDLLNRSFEVAQIYQQLVPYRTNRSELAFSTNDEYELALCQLLAGSRGLIEGERDMTEALQRELESPNPDLSAYRAFATSRVVFLPEALRAVSRHVTTGAVGRSSPESTNLPASPAEQVVIASRLTESLDPLPDALNTATPSPKPELEVDLPGIETFAPSELADDDMASVRVNPVRATAGMACRYCSATLPEGRSVVFCPSCGHNLTVQHCPACDAELEIGWKFCISCGRNTE